MSDLTATEKRKFEKLLGMSSGWVLNYSNREFAEFVMDSTGRDIFDSRYDNGSGSKANRLRAFWKKEDNHIVGKLMSDMLDDIDQPSADMEICRLIVKRLRGQIGQTPAHTAPHPPTQDNQHAEQQRISQVLAQLKEEFVQLTADKNRNKAGLSFEPFLSRLLETFQLKPRLPFRIAGEQIDGSFELDGEIYLLELKWENHALPEAPLLAFGGKIAGKSSFTRGVFVAVNGISVQAQDAITRGKQPTFFVVDGYDLMMILHEMMSLPEFLRRRYRLMAEEGRVCVPFAELFS
jgi:hypothetical protein